MTASGRAVLAALLRLEPAPATFFRLAARMGVGALVATAVPILAGHVGWVAYAMFGLLAGIFGGPVPGRRRWRLQAGLGLLFTLSAVSGTLVGLSPARAWLAIPLCAVLAAVCALASDRYRWRPAGPLFVVFAASSFAAIPAVPGDLLPATLVTAGAAVFAILLGLAERAIWGRRLPAEAGWSGAPPVELGGGQLVSAAGYGLAVAVAGALAAAAGIPHAGWAMVAAVVPLGAAELRLQFLRAAHRVLGTVVGLGVAGALLWLDLPPLGIAIALAVLQFCVDATIARHYGLALVFVTSVPLLMTQLLAPQPPGALLVERLVETLLGVAVGTLAVLLLRPRPRAQAV